ncbi:HK97-gp10 family putative phage morphogenesis protein [Fulvimarina sp. 2208YS6-2-32]|uniref:HK97-gp10 family putative phage morphogenesis protein n=1 Tax=Fulvimarina uroteuthidis TaxID=3098149 RepID=A0ABU5I7E4_9HYPH|nr:HK97-gp10 family putative phage morphogenesis protein [Fulvimarina sp. 2208YS6-2-32]MDY8111161.1 HK97-gp10 family putative phage morphogenesis protein [Fulvimarina sp. 2208YS6-2-32]
MARTSDQLKRLQKRMAAIPLAVREAIIPALDRSADQLVAAAKHLAPEDDGDLRDSIRKEPGEHELQRKIVAGDEATFYATFVEHGTAETPAQPFLFPSYRLNRKQIEARIKRAVNKAVKDEWGKR